MPEQWRTFEKTVISYNTAVCLIKTPALFPLMIEVLSESSDVLAFTKELLILIK